MEPASPSSGAACSMTTRLKVSTGTVNGELVAATPAGAVMHLQASVPQQGAVCPGAIEWA